MRKFRKIGAALIAALLLLNFKVINVSAAIEKGNGIDISNWQDIKDYKALKHNGVTYSYIKATESTSYRDIRIDQHYNGCKNANIKVGFYHFMSDWTSPVEQAQYFYNIVKNYDNDLLNCLDIETNSRAFSKEQLSQRVIEFCEEYKRLSGEDIIIYTGSYFQRINFTQEVINKYKMWIAHYYVNSPEVAFGTNLVGHQFSDRYYINGFYLDGDIFTTGIEVDGSNKNIQAVYSTYSNTVDYSKYSNYISYKGHTVLELQILLNKYGYSLIEDGVYGECTHKALGDYQYKNGLEVDHLAGVNTFNSLYNNLGVSWTKKVQATIGAVQDGIVGDETLSKVITLKQGSDGALVKLLQERLNYYGFNCGSVDGVFGYNTYKALRSYQYNRGLSVDGVCGKNTWKQLML